MENKRKFRPDPGIKLMDQVRQVLRYHHYAYRTEKTYCDWIVHYSKYFGDKKHPRTGVERRHHVLESGLQKAVKVAVDRAGITKRVGCHTFVLSFATHMLEDGANIRVVQELMGHADVKTTEIYAHVMEKDISATLSPLDSM